MSALALANQSQQSVLQLLLSATATSTIKAVEETPPLFFSQ
jgi:hypothetical protein